MKTFKRSEINGLMGSTFLTTEGVKLLIERELGDELLHVIELPSGATHRVEDPLTGEMNLPDYGWFERSIAEGMRQIADPTGPLAPARKAASVLDRADILKMDPYAEARLAVILFLLGKGVHASDPDLSSTIDEAWTPDLAARFGKRPPTSTVRSWFGRCRNETVELGDMVSMSGRVPRETRLDPAVEAIIEQERPRYWANRGVKNVDVEAAVSTALAAENVRRAAAGEPELTPPGKETIRRRIKEMECRETYAEKYGEAAARRKYDGSGRGISTSRILQVAIMDDTVVDLVTCLDGKRGMIAGRPYLCVLMDAYSRVVLGLRIGFEPPTVSTAAACLRDANAPKLKVRKDRRERYPALTTLNGKPGRVVTDNGKNYVAPAFTEMLMDLGITHELAPVHSPRHKAIIERFFRTLNTFLIDKLPGATLDPSLLRKLGIDPASEAIVFVDELRALVDEFLYVYHISNHSGIDAAPLDRWQRSALIHGRDMILDDRKFAIVTGTVVHGKRVTANGGVRMFGNQWKGSGLEEIVRKLGHKEPHARRLSATVGMTTKVKYDPDDLLHVHVFVGDDWVRLENTQPEYAAGLSLWQHRQIQAWAKREKLKFNTAAERLAARDELNRTIRKAFPDMDNRQRRAMMRIVGAEAAPAPTVEVILAEAEHRHDGLGKIVSHDVPVEHRLDAHRKPSRPAVDESGNDDDGVDPAAEDGGDDDRSDAGARDVFGGGGIVEDGPVDDDDAAEEEYR